MTRQISLPSSTGNAARDQIYALLNRAQDAGATFSDAYDQVSDSEQALFDEAAQLDEKTALRTDLRIPMSALLEGGKTINAKWNAVVAAVKQKNGGNFAKAWEKARQENAELYAMYAALKG